MTTRMPASPLRLTELTDCGGCAAKLGADVLADVLAGLGAHAAPDELIAGLQPPDDAAVYRLSPDLAVIGTLDFFPPLVDDPRTFGEIAAANALSDVFAMGGRVLFAMAIAAFPEEMPRDALAAIFDGAAAKVREAGGTLAGGHTIRDAEPKYGLAVVGVGTPRPPPAQGRRAARRRARAHEATRDRPPGQRRTPGTDAARRTWRRPSIRCAASTARRRRSSSHTASAPRPTSPGFGLLGHGLEMARASGARFVFDADALPALDGALDLAAAGVETGGAAHNRRFVAPELELALDVAPGNRRARARSADVGWPACRHSRRDSRARAGRPRGRRRVELDRRPGRARLGRGAALAREEIADASRDGRRHRHHRRGHGHGEVVALTGTMVVAVTVLVTVRHRNGKARHRLGSARVVVTVCVDCAMVTV